MDNQTEASGLLQVNVFQGNLGQPVPNALVTVTDPESDEVLQEDRTDQTGQTPQMPLETPPVAYSLSFGQPQPFSAYNVKVTLPGKADFVVQNLPMFPESTSIQNVLLPAENRTVTIPEPVLWGDFPPKIPEAEVKPLPPPTNLTVLPTPVVPSIIVVHAGVPNDDTAPNYTVGFKDYIKNVASSEIYCTWPEAALRANILAIQSFTLNRVFTEWYRGKGYDFTVTNSTAFDQSFTFDRNIFKEISDIVDETFTTYITRPDIRQPLLTQYADGKEVVREGWLSQWGSKDLADQGYTASEILRHYYGSDVYLKQAEKVEGIPLSFPGTVLRMGSSGESVRTIQEQLNAIAKNYPAIPKLVVDGIYGAETATSVKKFQEIFGLPANGEVNFPTWYQISDIYVAVEKLA